MKFRILFSNLKRPQMSDDMLELDRKSTRLNSSHRT